MRCQCEHIDHFPEASGNEAPVPHPYFAEAIEGVMVGETFFCRACAEGHMKSWIPNTARRVP